MGWDDGWKLHYEGSYAGYLPHVDDCELLEEMGSADGKWKGWMCVYGYEVWRGVGGI